LADQIHVTLTCETDEGIPTPIIRWMENGFLIAETRGSITIGNNGAHKRISYLILRTDKTLNGVKYQCFTGSVQSQLYTLQVKGK
jgi:hypothetical protein